MNENSSWFYPPPSGDPGGDRNARTLQFTCLVLTLTIGLIAVLNTASQETHETPLFVFAMIGLVGAMAMNRAGHWRWASRTAVGAVLLVAVLLVLEARDGFRSHAMLLFPSMLLIGVLLLDRRSYLTTATLVIVTVAALGITEKQRIFRSTPPTRTPTTYGSIFFVDLALFVFAVIGSRIARDNESNVLDLRHTVARLSAANGELSDAAGALRQKEAEASARAAELQAIMDAVPAAIFIAKDPECNHITGNRAGYALLRQPLGSDFSKIPSGHFRIMHNGVEIPSRDAPMRFAARSGRPVSNREQRLIFNNGAYLDLLVNAEPLLDQEGSSRGAVAAVTDITERRRIEEDLRHSEGRFRSLFENATVGLYRTTPGGAIEAANSALIRMLGYTSFAELAERNLEESGFEPAYNRSAFRERLEREGQIRGLEASWARRDGSTVYVRESAACVRDESGAVRYYQGIVEDITERKQAEDDLRQSEARFRAIVETSQEGIFFIDSSGVTLYRSPACELVDGYTAEERLGHKSCENVHPDDLEGALAALSTLAGGKPQRPIQYRIRRKDGEWRWVESAARSLLDNPSVRAIVVAASDITERRLAEEESGRLSQQLAHAQKMESVGRLAGGIAHDFNNIMSVVLLHADSAQDEIAAGESPADSIAAIHDAALKAIALGQQLMAFSSKQSLHTEVLDLNSVVEDAQKLVTRLIGEDVKVVFQRGAGLSSVRADRGQLGQVIVNLAVNSRDAMPEGGVFTIETAAVEFGDADARRHPEGKPGSYIMMRVRDTGLGMTPETRARIFEPFFSTKEIGKGTGLGLSLVYGIVKQSGGFITVESEPGRGTEFRMYLPAVADTPARSSDGAIPCLRGGSETILLVEDEAPLRHKLRDILQGAGYRVLAASNGYEAAALALGEPGEIDLLLTDVVMPGLSGPRLSQQLRFLRPTTRVLHMSGYPDDIRGSGGRLLRDFIQKPFSREKLLRCVRQTLDATESSITAPSSTGA